MTEVKTIETVFLVIPNQERRWRWKV